MENLDQYINWLISVKLRQPKEPWFMKWIGPPPLSKGFMIDYFKFLANKGKISSITLEKLKKLDPMKLYKVCLEIERGALGELEKLEWSKRISKKKSYS